MLGTTVGVMLGSLEVWVLGRSERTSLGLKLDVSPGPAVGFELGCWLGSFECKILGEWDGLGLGLCDGA